MGNQRKQTKVGSENREPTQGVRRAKQGTITENQDKDKSMEPRQGQRQRRKQGTKAGNERGELK